ncbi:MAG: dipeptide/oligopeptide/nickel ABC transporter ATP-binding protein [Rhodobacterales bacterium 12-64-8]|nr:MAG: dipeptide/oligopeptide/nickel ABC transporter ATP-binding protein [Rhodobacterales bacterium 12-64-8]
MNAPVYQVEGLVIDLFTPTVSVRAVDGAGFHVAPGETLAIVGESGSGKTVMTLGPLGLLPEGVAVDLRGTARADGKDILAMSPADLSRLRGGFFGVIFQDPMSALNPMLKIGPQLAEQARRYAGLSAAAARKEAVSLLARSGLPDPEDRYDRYPHELSGGMLQRAMIALALAARPRVLIADEPTTALDATVQAQILALIRTIQKEDGIAVILITHDIGAVSVLADRVAVLYAGQVAEEGSAVDVLTAPVHPYTRGLLASVPDFRSDSASGTKEIPGIPPNQAQLEAGCRFADRCDQVQPQCHTRRPRLQTVGTGAVLHRVACPVVIAAEGIVTHD